MKNVAKRVAFIFGFGLLGLCVCFLVSCAGQRQGVVCDEIEYRYNSMAYSPDQRVFMEEELRACREEEAKNAPAQPVVQPVYYPYGYGYAQPVAPQQNAAAVQPQAQTKVQPQTPASAQAPAQAVAKTEDKKPEEKKPEDNKSEEKKEK